MTGREVLEPGNTLLHGPHAGYMNIFHLLRSIRIYTNLQNFLKSLVSSISYKYILMDDYIISTL